MARRAAAVKAERQANDSVILLDAGSSLLGGWELDPESKAQMTVQSMNRMGYDALTVGGSELTLRPEGLVRAMDMAEFAFLSANLTVGRDGDLLVQPYTLVQRGSRHIAVIGVTAPEETDIYQLEGTDVGVLDPIDSVRRAVFEVGDRADAIIVLSYLGLEKDRELAQQVDGIDLIVGGRTNDDPTEPIWNQQTSTLIAQARRRGEWLGVIDLELNERGQVVGYEVRPVVLDNTIADDPDFSAWFESAQPTPTPEPSRAE